MKRPYRAFRFSQLQPNPIWIKRFEICCHPVPASCYGQPITANLYKLITLCRTVIKPKSKISPATKSVEINVNKYSLSLATNPKTISITVAIIKDLISLQAKHGPSGAFFCFILNIINLSHKSSLCIHFFIVFF